MSAINSVNLDLTGVQALYAQAPKRAGQVVMKLANDGQAYIQTHWSPLSPSPEGEAPAVDTGALTNSIHTWMVDDHTAAVGDGVKYGDYLEFGTRDMAARPWLLPAMDAIAKTVPDAFGAIVRLANG